MSCEITGTAEITETQIDGRRELAWSRADPAIHVSSELLETADEQGLAFISAKYEIGEWCPHEPFSKHARLRPDK